MENKWMKRLVCVLLVVCVMSSGIVGLAAELEREFESVALGEVGLTSSEWYSTDPLFGAFMAMELGLAYKEDDEAIEEITSIMVYAISEDEIYISKEGNFLTLYMFGEDKVLMASYSPIIKECASSVMEYSVSPSVLMKALDNNNSDMVYKSVDNELFVEILEDLLETLKK